MDLKHSILEYYPPPDDTGGDMCYRQHRHLIVEQEEYLYSLSYAGDFKSIPLGEFFYNMNQAYSHVAGIRLASRVPRLPRVAPLGGSVTTFNFYLWQVVAPQKFLEGIIEPYLRNSAKESDVRFTCFEHPKHKEIKIMGFIPDQKYAPRSAPPPTVALDVKRYLDKLAELKLDDPRSLESMMYYYCDVINGAMGIPKQYLLEGV